MLNVVDFLDRVGQDAKLRRGASQVDIELALANTQIEPGVRSAILAGDQAELETLLGGKILFSVQFPGKEDEEEDEGDERDTEEGRPLESVRVVSQAVGI